MSVSQLVRSSKEIDVIASQFDGLDHAGRMREIVALSAKDMARLYDLSAGRGCVLTGDYVPANKPPLTEVIHWGRNSLPAFRTFQKRFCWPSRGHVPKVALGYNEQSTAVFTGPGYFTAREDKGEGGVPTVVIDYKLLPNEKAESWPKILPNTAKLSRFIYNGMQDWMWKVSNHVTIGRARKDSGWMDAWFILCRED